MSDIDHDLRGQWLAVKARANNDVLTDADVEWIIARFLNHDEVPRNGVCMALAKRFRMDCCSDDDENWHTCCGEIEKHGGYGSASNKDLNRAICLCCAVMTAPKD